METVFANFHFLRPYWLGLLIPIVAWLLLQRRGQSRGGAWAAVCDSELLPHVINSASGAAAWRPYLVALSAALLSVAIAGPTWQRLPLPVFRDHAALVIALDLSRSMDAQDVAPSRLERARFKLTDLLKARRAGQTALVAYAAQPFTVSPLTDDSANVLAQLPALESAIMPSQGSRPDRAASRASELLTQAGMPSGDILLVTDGVDQDYVPAMLDAAAPLNIRISVLAVATNDGAPIPTAGGGFAKDAAGNIVLAQLRDGPLRELAKQTGGLYLPVQTGNEDIDRYLEFLELRRTRGAAERTDLFADQWYDAGPWLLLMALPLCALLYRRGLLLALTVVSLAPLEPVAAAESGGWWRNSDQQAARAFESENYERAAELFTSPDWQAAAAYRAGDYAAARDRLADDSDAEVDLAANETLRERRYNLGNALARMGEFEDALAAYDSVLEADPSHEDARHNRDLIDELLKQQEQQSQGGGQSENEDQQSGQQDQQSGGGQQGGNPDEERSAESDATGGQQQNASGEQSDEADAAQQRASEQEQEDASSEQTAEQQAMDDPPRESAGAQDIDAQADAGDESSQATEQWLRRIPDDPAGLLRRKFRYQYQQRYAGEANQEAPW
ncbi:MAG: VWA domain-containing protein [Gammaproteobacteria bacterium]|nr:VWA domain-containing protein [Gammaproteobacteria bacterium]